MKQQSFLIAAYSVLLIMGGAIGYFVAGSIASIIMSVIFALLLLSCSILMSKGYFQAYDIAIGIVFCLLLFFGYRFFTTFKITPAGLMMLISGALLVSLSTRRTALKKFE